MKEIHHRPHCPILRLGLGPPPPVSGGIPPNQFEMKLDDDLVYDPPGPGVGCGETIVHVVITYEDVGRHRAWLPTKVC